MAVKRKLFIAAVVIGSLSYWLYCPVPDGYSPQSTVTLSVILPLLKLNENIAVAAHNLGLGSFGTIDRFLSSFMVGVLEKPGSDPEIKETDLTFDGVPVRMYEPADRTGFLPGIVWYHGGGYTIGDLNYAADTIRRIIRNFKCVVVSVDYRLAPEHLYPAAFEDCLAATKYFITNAKQFKVNPKRIALGGDSAGGNLAATVSLKLRDESFKPANKLQLLIYPHVQSLDYQLPSMMKNADGPLLTRRMMGFFASLYLHGNLDWVDVFLNNDHVSPQIKKLGVPFVNPSKLPKKYLVDYQKPDVNSGNETMWIELKDILLNPYYTPLVAFNLTNLPKAYVFTAEHDALRDEGFLYVERLREAGVPVTHFHSETGFHGIITFAKLLPEANEVLLDMIKFVAKNL